MLLQSHAGGVELGYCFGYYTGQGNDPRLLRAAVARGGMPAVAAPTGCKPSQP